MSQVTNTTTGISNNNNNTPWNRTPGKPGIGTGSVVVGGGTVVSSSYPTLSTTSSIIPSWSSTSRNDPGDLMLQDGGLISMEGGGAVGSSSVGQMWPIPGIFDANQPSDRNMIVGSGGVGGGGEFLPQESSLTDNQWVTTTPFSGQTTSNINSLLGSSNTFPINNNINNVTTHHNHNSNQTLNPWSFDNPTPTHNNNSIHVPRAITGQQLNNLVSLTNHSLDTLNLNRSRHYAQHWTTGTTLTTTTTAVAITTTTMPLAAARTAILDNEQDLLNGDPSIPGINFGNKSRWPGQNMNRLPGKQQQQLQQQQHPPTPHILPNITSTGMRWPPGGSGGGATTSTHVQGMWPMTDQRRLGTTVPGPWSTNPTGMMDSMNNTGGFFNQSNQSITPRGGGVTSEFPASLNPSIRGVNQAFRTPPSAFYPPPITPGFPASTTTISSQRMFMNSQPHTHQLQQQQSMIRAHVIRQLFNLGFTEDEIQPIFADTTNTSMERALIDLRDRSGHPGIDELINNLRSLTSNLLPTLNSNDVRQQQQQADLPGQTMPSSRSVNTIRGMEMIKSNLIPMMNNHPSQPTENLELSLQLLQQRETQILQTIVQLHSKHQDLNQKLSHIRSATNVPFATNPVIHELQLQAFQVSQQIDAQQAQLKHVRSQAGMLRQITTMSASSSASICQALNTTHNTNTTTITPSSSTLLLGSNNNNNHTSSNSGVGVGQQTMMSTVQQQQQIIPNCITGITNPIGNGKGFNSIVSSASTSSSTSSVLPSSSSSTTSTASWCGVTTQISKSNQLFNISAVGNNINNSNNGSESIDFLPDQTNFNMIDYQSLSLNYQFLTTTETNKSV
ncbi:unnamed protein product [Schistosoma turkestanicum]|nr:unnamed protein product [Schistosoma turkestanicum]